MADSVTTLLRSGSSGVKTDIVIVGDGYTAEEQDDFNAYVDKAVMAELFSQDFFAESKQAFNIHRINLESEDSGVSQAVYDTAGVRLVSTTNRDTALDTIYSGNWNRCWMEDGPDTRTLLNTALRTWVPDWNFVLIVQNEARGGGCRRGSYLYITRGVGWPTIAHELGHGLGDLADEYCRPATYRGSEPKRVNVTANTDQATLKWRKFVNPSTPVPTGVNPNPGAGGCAPYNQGTRPGSWDSAADAGVFEGGNTFSTSVYRPAESCRMRSNRPEFCPVCYTEMKRLHHAATGQTFENIYPADLNGDGRDDLLIHNGNAIQTYRSDGSRLEHLFSAVGSVPGSWQFMGGDQFLIGDFNNDGVDEVVVFNSTNWPEEYLGLLASDGSSGLRLIRRYDNAMSGWQFGRDDQYFVGDFDGDGRDDLVVFNGANWNQPYLALLRSTGSGFDVVRRYDTDLDGWEMKRGDQIFVGDFDGDGKAGLCIFNGTDHDKPRLAVFGSDGRSLLFAGQQEGKLPGWGMAKNDKYFVGDFNGDGRDDLFVFNGHDWDKAYLSMLSSNGSSFRSVRRYDGNAPGWQMRRHDRYWVADLNGDGRADLVVANSADWPSNYLGTLVSTSTALSGRWSQGRVGDWSLGDGDDFVVCDYEGAAGTRNIIAHNRSWLGMMRVTPALSTQRLYRDWIHNYRYGRN